MSIAQTEAPASFAGYASLLRQLHGMIAEGTDESDEGDSLRDAMDRAWGAMSEAETERARALSADLYTLGDPERQCGPPVDAADWQRRYQESVGRADWDGALALIREDRGPMSPFEAMFARARWWLQLGDLESALLFADAACRLKSDEWNVALLRAQLLLGLGHEEGAAHTLADFAESHPSAVPIEQRDTFLKAVQERRRAIDRSNRRLIDLAMDHAPPAA